AAHHDWKLDKASSCQLFWTQRRIGGSEVHSPALDLPNAGARPHGLVADPDASLDSVGFRPSGQDRIHKRRPGTDNVLCWRVHTARAQHRNSNQGRIQQTPHQTSPYYWYVTIVKGRTVTSDRLRRILQLDEIVTIVTIVTILQT